MLQLISTPVAQPDAGLRVVELKVERRTVAKRLWRGVAADGCEFGFSLAAPLKHGDTVWQTEAVKYVRGDTLAHAGRTGGAAVVRADSDRILPGDGGVSSGPV